jgi:hypothetical protein
MQDATLGAGEGDVLIDKINLSLATPSLAGASIYEAEYADLRSGAVPAYTSAGVSSSGTASIGTGQSATFWVYSKADAASSVAFDRRAGGTASVTLNGRVVSGLSIGSASVGTDTVPLFLSGGINKITVTGTSGTLSLDRLRVTPASTALTSTVVQAEAGALTGAAVVSTAYDLASGGSVVRLLGDSLTTNDLTVTVNASTAGQKALTVRFASAEFAAATHYNPDPIGRHADISINGGAATRVLFPNTFHWNQFWELTIPVTLVAGSNTIRFSGDEEPNWDGVTYNAYGQRSAYLPNLDSIAVTPVAGSKVTTTGCPVATLCESEKATLAGGAVVATNHPGFTGTGFVAGFTTVGAKTTQSVSVAASGSRTLVIRYSAGPNGPSSGVDRTVALLINGVAQTVTLPKTTTWDVWADANVAVTLPAGTSTIAIEYQSTTTGWVNLDSIRLLS